MGFFSDLFRSLSAKEEKPYEPLGAENDMLMILKGADMTTLKHDLHDFLKKYNTGTVYIRIALHSISPGIHAITFPYIQDFGFFIYFANFIRIDEQNNNGRQIRSWCTVKPGWEGINADVAQQRAMFYIPDDDKEWDIVNMVLPSGHTYEIDMNFRVKVKQTTVLFHAPPYSLHDVKQYPAEIIS